MGEHEPTQPVEPLRLIFTVACSADQAFQLWTEEVSAWWPVIHTVSRSRGVRVVIEPRVGGRIYERTPTGAQIEWGTVTLWQPPSRLVYRWHFMSRPEDATEVDIRFADRGGDTTMVSIEHRGFERFADGTSRRDENRTGWEGLLPSFILVCADDEFLAQLGEGRMLRPGAPDH